MIKIHHLQNSRSQRVIWLLEELGLEYEVIFHNRNQNLRHAPDSLINIHSLGKAPVLLDNDVLMAETGAIFEYLLEKYPTHNLEPDRGSFNREKYIYWRHFSESSFMPFLEIKLVFNGLSKAVPFFVRPIINVINRGVNAKYLNPNINSEIDFIERHLEKNEWFAGAEFSAVDILIAFPLEAVHGRVTNENKQSNITRFINAVKLRPAYRRALVKGNWSNTEYEKYWSFLSK